MSNPIRPMRPTGLILLLSLLAIASAPAADVQFRFQNHSTLVLTNRKVTITPTSAPSTNGTYTVIGDSLGYTNDYTGSLLATGLVSGYYRVTVQGLAGNAFNIYVPPTNTVQNANDLTITTAGTISPLNAAYSQAGANARFILKDGGYGTNIVLSNVTLIGTVIGAGTGGGGNLQTNADQFAANPTLTIKEGATLSNLVLRPFSAEGTALTIRSLAAQDGEIVSILDNNGDPLFAIQDNGIIWGNGSQISALNASLLGSGTVPLARLSGITSNELADATITSNQIATATITTNKLSKEAHELYLAGTATTNEWATNIVRTVFVATNGSDTWPGTFLFPKASLSNALEVYSSNYTVHMQPGLYTMVGRANAAVSGNPCSIPCEGKQQLIIDGPGAKMYWPDGLLSGLLIHNCTNVLVKNIEMVGNRTNWMMPPAWASNNVQTPGIYATIEVGDSAHIKFDSITLRDGWNHGLMIDAPQYRSTYRSTNGIVVINSRFENFGLIREWTTPPTGLITYDGSGVVVSGGAVVAHNRSENCSAGIELYPLDTLGYNENLPKTLIIGNVVLNSRAAGLNIQGCPALVVGNRVQYLPNTNHWTNLVWQQHCALYLVSSKGAIVTGNEFKGFTYGINASLTTNNTFANNYVADGAYVQFQYGQGNRFVGNSINGFTNQFKLNEIRDSDISGNVLVNVGTNMDFGSITIAGVISNVTLSGNVLRNDNVNFWGIWYYPGATVSNLRLIDNVGFVGFSGKYYLPAGALSEFRELQGILMDTLSGSETNVQLIGSLGPVGLALGGTLYATGAVATPRITNAGNWSIYYASGVLVFTNVDGGFSAQLTGNGLYYSNAEEDYAYNRLTSSSVVSNIVRSRLTNTVPLLGRQNSDLPAFGGTNVQWRLVKTGVLTNVVDGSAAAWYPSNRTFFVVHNNGNGTITEWTLDGVCRRAITNPVAGKVPDAESITYIGGSQFAVVDEDNNRIFILSITNETTGWITNNTTIVQAHASIGVDGGTASGLEGIAWDPDRNGWWVVREKGPAQLMFMAADGSSTNNWFSTAQMQTFTNANNTDFSDICYDQNRQMLWITQDEAGQNDRVIGISLQTSNLVFSVSCTNFGQLEGVSITPDGHLILVGEVNQFAILEPVWGGLNSGLDWTQITTNGPSVPSFPVGIGGNLTMTGAVSTTAMIVTNNAGIGTNSPQARLDVIGNNAVNNVLRVGTTNRPTLASITTNGIFLIVAGASSSNAVVGGLVFFDLDSRTNCCAAIGTPTNMAQVSIGAHTLTNTGDLIEFEASGQMANARATTNRILVVYGATTVLDTGTTVASNTAWRVTGMIARSGNSSQRVTATLAWDGVAPWKQTNVVLTIAENNGIANILKLQSGSQATAVVTQSWFSAKYFPASR